jgi:hypothetical protein
MPNGGPGPRGDTCDAGHSRHGAPPSGHGCTSSARDCRTPSGDSLTHSLADRPRHKVGERPERQEQAHHHAGEQAPPPRQIAADRDIAQHGNMRKPERDGDQHRWQPGHHQEHLTCLAEALVASPAMHRSVRAKDRRGH